MKKENYTRLEVKEKIENAIAREHTNSKAFQAWNLGKNAKERENVEKYVVSVLVALMHGF